MVYRKLNVEELTKVIELSIKKIESCEDNDINKWNKEEMDYYDSDVKTEKQRIAFIDDIQKRFLKPKE